MEIIFDITRILGCISLGILLNILYHKIKRGI